MESMTITETQGVNETAPSKERNCTVDILRGIAILMVLFGHVAQGSTTGLLDSTLGNVIWSLQMPLFMITSGYCMRYSNLPRTLSQLGQYLVKRSLALLLPWICWIFLVKGLLLGTQGLGSYASFIIYNMDFEGYWFLFTLWTITVLFSVSFYLSSRLVQKDGVVRPMVCVCFLVLGAGLLAAIGSIFGFTFFGIKLSIYYLPQFAIGYLFGCAQTLYSAKPWFQKCKRYSVFPSMLIYCLIIFNINLYSAETTVWNLAMRFLAAVCGTIILTNVIQCPSKNTKPHGAPGILSYFGVNSMQYYTVHLFFTGIFSGSVQPLRSVDSAILCTVNYIAMLAVTYVVIRLLSANPTTNLLLFGKRSKA